MTFRKKAIRVTEKIPRRIIQTGKSANLPLFDKAVSVNLRLLNRGFEYLFFDDSQVEQFVDAEYPQYRSVFNSFSVRIQRYDFFRYLAVYHFGGFYLDTDVLLASHLDDLLEFSCVFPFEHMTYHSFLRAEYGMDWEVGNYAFGAAAGHPFLQAIINNCVRAQQNPDWAELMMKPIPWMFRSEYYVLDTTGPGLVSRTLAEYPYAREQVKILFPEDVRDPNSWFRFGNYGVHLQAGSWRKRESLLRRVLHRNWQSKMRKLMLKEGDKLGGERSLEFSIVRRQEVQKAPSQTMCLP
jgi:hypothetical protein